MIMSKKYGLAIANEAVSAPNQERFLAAHDDFSNEERDPFALKM
jgi:hypothetical protein